MSHEEGFKSKRRKKKKSGWLDEYDEGSDLDGNHSPAPGSLGILPSSMMPGLDQAIGRQLQEALQPESETTAQEAPDSTKPSAFDPASPQGWINLAFHQRRDWSFECRLQSKDPKHSVIVKAQSGVNSNLHTHCKSHHSTLYSQMKSLADSGRHGAIPELLKTHYVTNVGRMDAFVVRSALGGNITDASVLWHVWGLHHGISDRSSDSPWLTSVFHKLGVTKSSFIRNRRSRVYEQMALYHFVKAQIKLELDNIAALSFTYDGWTNQHRHRFIVITIHYMNAEGFAQSRIFDLVLFRQAHTTDNLVALLKKRLRDELPPHIYIHAGVGDNASNSSAAIEEFAGGNIVPCFAHTLQLAIRDGIRASSPLTQIIQHVRDLAVSVRNHSELQYMMEMQQGDESKTLILDQVTRWNSTYYMVKRFLELLPYLSLLAIKGHLSSPLFAGTQESHVQLLVVPQFLNILSKFEEITVRSQGAFMYDIPEFVKTLHEHLDATQREPLTPIALDFILNLRQGLIDRFSDITTSASLPLMALALRPEGQPHIHSLPHAVQQDIWEALLRELHDLKNRPKASLMLSEALSDCRIQVASSKDDFRTFWQGSLGKDSILIVSPLASMLCSVPATSSPSESAFSEASKRGESRPNLSDDRLRDELVIKSYTNFKPGMSDVEKAAFVTKFLDNFKTFARAYKPGDHIKESSEFLIGKGGYHDQAHDSDDPEES